MSDIPNWLGLGSGALSEAFDSEVRAVNNGHRRETALIAEVERLRAELAALKKRESPESAWERAYRVGWHHGATATVCEHPHLSQAPCQGMLVDDDYRPPAPAAEAPKCGTCGGCGTRSIDGAIAPNLDPRCPDCTGKEGGKK